MGEYKEEYGKKERTDSAGNHPFLEELKRKTLPRSVRSVTIKSTDDPN